jgi:hypothetical protein
MQNMMGQWDCVNGWANGQQSSGSKPRNWPRGLHLDVAPQLQSSFSPVPGWWVGAPPQIPLKFPPWFHVNSSCHRDWFYNDHWEPLGQFYAGGALAELLGTNACMPAIHLEGLQDTIKTGGWCYCTWPRSQKNSRQMQYPQLLQNRMNLSNPGLPMVRMVQHETVLCHTQSTHNHRPSRKTTM